MLKSLSSLGHRLDVSMVSDADDWLLLLWRWRRRDEGSMVFGNVMVVYCIVCYVLFPPASSLAGLLLECLYHDVLLSVIRSKPGG